MMIKCINKAYENFFLTIKYMVINSNKYYMYLIHILT
jgi:hypothetical protein